MAESLRDLMPARSCSPLAPTATASIVSSVSARLTSSGLAFPPTSGHTRSWFPATAAACVSSAPTTMPPYFSPTRVSGRGGSSRPCVFPLITRSRKPSREAGRGSASVPHGRVTHVARLRPVALFVEEARAIHLDVGGVDPNRSVEDEAVTLPGDVRHGAERRRIADGPEERPVAQTPDIEAVVLLARAVELVRRARDETVIRDAQLLGLGGVTRLEDLAGADRWPGRSVRGPRTLRSLRVHGALRGCGRGRRRRSGGLRPHDGSRGRAASTEAERETSTHIAGRNCGHGRGRARATTRMSSIQQLRGRRIAPVSSARSAHGSSPGRRRVRMEGAASIV